MKKLNYLGRLSALVVMFAMSTFAAMANNNKDYYSKVNVTSTGNGLVYVSDASLVESPEYAETKFEQQTKNTSNPSSHYYYLYAQPTTGYVLDGWYENEDCSTLSTRSNGISVEMKEKVADATVNLWAKFVDYTTATKDNPVNMTSLIFNSDFDCADWKAGWTNNGFSKQSGNVNFSGTFAEIWDKDATKTISGSIEQTLSNLPAGSYELSAKAVCGVDGKDYIYAKVGDLVNETVLPVTNVGTARDYSVLFTVEEGQSVTIGFARENSKNWSAVDDFSLLYFGDVQMEEAVLSVKSGKYGTFVAPFDVVLPEEVTAYTVEAKEGCVALTEFKKGGETLPAGNPVIVKGTDAISKTYVGEPSVEATVEANGLVGFYQSGTDVPEGAYVLQTQNGEQSFYKVGSTTVNGVKNRCYLPAAAAGARLRIVLADDEAATAVNGVNTEATPAEYYSTNGMKVAAPQKGMNIVKMNDGSVKKMIVK